VPAVARHGHGFQLVAGVAAAAGAAQMLPSVVSLGQWSQARVLPGGWCRWRGPAGPRVALTFDDGPVPGDTDRTLALLDELAVRATFFCVGERAAAHPQLVRQIAARGHEVGVHGYAHAHHFARPPHWIGRDLDRALDALAAAGVERPRWYRPPFGQTTGPTLWAARRRDLELVLWSCWAREWTAGTTTADVVDRVTGTVEPGDIVLLHDTETGDEPGSLAAVLGALPPIVEHLRARGLEPVTLGDLVAA
jgi:peptidoglycan/xylan/chitin deacetylase (PgdA/CDA1 family)